MTYADEPEVLGPADVARPSNPSSIPLADDYDDEVCQLPPEERMQAQSTTATDDEPEAADGDADLPPWWPSNDPVQPTAPQTSHESPVDPAVSTAAGHEGETAPADPATSSNAGADDPTPHGANDPTPNEEPNMTSLSESIAKQMAARDLKSVAMVAKATGISAPTVKKALEGQGKVNKRTAPAWAEFLGISEAAVRDLPSGPSQEVPRARAPRGSAKASTANDANAAPKRRGRPPKAAASGDEAPKRRGRPPKAAVNDDAAPKRRGRPPKQVAKQTPVPAAAGADGDLFSVTILGHTKAFRSIDELKAFVARFEDVVTG